jgi:ABC-type lipoprotein export system ATPase subunit
VSTSSRILAREVAVEVSGAVLLASAGLAVEPAEVVAVMGPSGSGKTTLLGCLSGTVVPSQGSVEVDGVRVSELSPAARARFRREHVGLVFQEPELLDELTVGENVALQMLFAGGSRSETRDRAAAALERVGVGNLLDARVARLSGGEAQRVAVARALASSSSVILADEPTASLDVDNARQVTRLLVEAARRDGTAVVIATHDPEVAAACDRTVLLRDTTPAPR